MQHHSASLVMPISDPRDRFFYPHHKPMQDTYYPYPETCSDISVLLKIFIVQCSVVCYPYPDTSSDISVLLKFLF